VKREAAGDPKIVPKLIEVGVTELYGAADDTPDQEAGG
jgi:hypothetical protein